jgi:hypothetical protein
MLSGALQLRVQVDHRGDFYLLNEAEVIRTAFGFSQGTSDPHAPLATQAAAVALLTSSNFTRWGYYEDATFTRLREVALTWNASRSIARAIRTRSLSVTLSGRNLALWTKYKGADPEVSSPTSGYAGPYQDAGTTLPATYWLLRVNLGL